MEKIDVTNQEKSFSKISSELKVYKFGVLSEDKTGEKDWSYIGEMEEKGRFAWSNGMAGYTEPSLDFPELTECSPKNVESKIIYENGEIEFCKILKVFAYK